MQFKTITEINKIKREEGFFSAFLEYLNGKLRKTKVI